MISRHSALATLILSVTLAACGGGDETPDEPEEVATPSVFIIGNSLTYVPPGGSPESGVFTGGWGVAASAQDKDFAHIVATTQALPLHVENRADLERYPEVPVPAWPITSATLVVVQLGDNGLPSRYAEIMERVRHAKKVVCVSTWWNRTERDAVIERECTAAGGQYVYIGDIFPVRQDPVGTYTDPGVDRHPHDWSMAQIAARVNAALAE